MSDGASANGARIRVGKWHVRIWRNGMEYGNNLGGRVVFFPWHPLKHKSKAK